MVIVVERIVEQRLIKDLDLETQLKEILSRRPCTVDTLAYITDRTSCSILVKLRRLQSWGLCKPITKREYLVWRWEGDG